jgi:hypothetical protein
MRVSWSISIRRDRTSIIVSAQVGLARGEVSRKYIMYPECWAVIVKGMAMYVTNTKPLSTRPLL